MTPARDAPVSVTPTAFRDAIRAFTPNARSITHSAQRPYDDPRLERFSDDDGYSYWFDPVDGAIVRAEAPARLYPEARPLGAEDRRTVRELREHALAVIGRQLPWFAGALSTFHPYEGNRRRSVYLFRWERADATAEKEVPGHVQIMLRADGVLLEYENGLTARGA
jgi:hypothetical protein